MSQRFSTMAFSDGRPYRVHYFFLMETSGCVIQEQFAP